MPNSLSPTTGTFFEFLLACILIVVAIRATRFGGSLLVTGHVIAVRIGRNEGRIIALAAVVPVVLRLLLLAIDPVPQPSDMEEFNHLLQADTYALGRLFNPVHPLAVMLQSYQLLEWPHYMSGRPPLPAIFLSIAVAVCGWPFAGNLLAIGLTSGALCWMLLGWVPRGWAVIGSFLAITTFCLFGYWVNSFWCPTTIVLGGALLMGVVPRVEREPRLRWAAIFVVGLVLLAGTRPLENCVYAGVICLWLAWCFLRTRRPPLLRKAVILFACPVMLGTIGIVLAQMGYDVTTTGNYRLMPYQIWRASQDFTPIFLWQPIGGHPIFFNPSAAQFAQWNINVVTETTQGGSFGLAMLLGRQAVTFRDLLGPLLLLPLLCWSPTWFSVRLKMRVAFVAACWIIFFLLFVSWAWFSVLIKAVVLLALLLRWRNANERLPILLVLIGFLATSLPTYYMNVYFAAFTAPLLILVVSGLRHMSQWSKPVGPSLAGFLMLGSAVVPVTQAAALMVGHPLTGPFLSHYDKSRRSPRHDALDILQNVPGQLAVFVRTEGDAPIEPVYLDPVWNGAEIDKQRIVWLRDLRPDWTATAQRYYQDRQPWLMLMDGSTGHFTLTPYPSASPPQAVPLSDLPIPDREVAQAIGAREH